MMDEEVNVAYQPDRQTHNVDYSKSVADTSYEDEDGNSYNGSDNDEDVDGNGVQRIPNNDYEQSDSHSNSQSHTKKRNLKIRLSSYEFAPRVPKAESVVPTPLPKNGGRNPLTDWSERETMILLDTWGERFIKRGRKSLRSEEWHEVSEKVSNGSRIERTDTQCRNRLDTLKKKYKKEKMKLGDDDDEGSVSEWVYFKKMDGLLSASRAGLSCGLDSGEFVFSGPGDYSGRANGVEVARDSPKGSESTEDGERVGMITAPRRKRVKRNRKSKGNGGNGKDGSLKLLVDSFRKFSDIYEKIEHGKRQQMAELEKMRMDFHRDLEMQKRVILERAQAEIARIQHGGEEDEDDGDTNAVVFAENVSG